ncbi:MULTISPECIES: phosphoserine phosphatase SerB [unclassified Campylobacter]|uniref:phosphoserine phosphatase SerB n=1 Tax=unclassified Campylobacter TaxID=2593542 RepID=UPI0022E9A297|nr:MULTISPECIES: phosphoserine phosphatase SerB [unclassified Campylobacter]MDA3043709.1 phosphoserine phosphatase SerB [Campylobacter sp. JMF_09 ED2]MDA3045340.1 phosphoserine phosphatase SerB [Campylobacter sp. JMF_07 ED4]MDA3061522.1 phosphoserine phosphatase SerB [Campylobacter sp. VBCF_02 NA5]MDA3064526.1 phosphoserine phosphatase SerB [Campylobacter sp. JMF_11 EL3]MDA3072219.1 phosphoserine phosphatase SerB [Campylobacter sp. VBCF_03 NA9]
MIKLCVFDFDSTLMDGETITNFAKSVGKEKEVKEITKRAMAGEIDFFESLQERAMFLKGMKFSDMQKIAQNLPFVPGAKELISYLKSKGITVVVFSGGFHVATDWAKEVLGFDASFANILHRKDGVLTGHVGGEMMFGYSKGVVLQQLKAILHLSADEVMCVGDGANDVAMFREAGLRIAFCANEILKKEATHCVDKKDLREIMQYV